MTVNTASGIPPPPYPHNKQQLHNEEHMRPEGKHLLTAANPGMLSQSKEIRKTGRKAEKGRG